MKETYKSAIRLMIGILLMCLSDYADVYAQDSFTRDVQSENISNLSDVGNDAAHAITSNAFFSFNGLIEFNSVTQQQQSYSRIRTSIEDTTHYRFHRLHNRLLLSSDNNTFNANLRFVSLAATFHKTRNNANEYYIFALRKLLI